MIALKALRRHAEPTHQGEQHRHGSRDRRIAASPPPHRASVNVKEFGRADLGETQCGEVVSESLGRHSGQFGFEPLNGGAVGGQKGRGPLGAIGQLGLQALQHLAFELRFLRGHVGLQWAQSPSRMTPTKPDFLSGVKGCFTRMRIALAPIWPIRDPAMEAIDRQLAHARRCHGRTGDLLAAKRALLHERLAARTN